MNCLKDLSIFKNVISTIETIYVNFLITGKALMFPIILCCVKQDLITKWLCVRHMDFLMNFIKGNLGVTTYR